MLNLYSKDEKKKKLWGKNYKVFQRKKDSRFLCEKINSHAEKFSTSNLMTRVSDTIQPSHTRLQKKNPTKQNPSKTLGCTR